MGLDRLGVPRVAHEHGMLRYARRAKRIIGAARRQNQVVVREVELLRRLLGHVVERRRTFAGLGLEVDTLDASLHIPYIFRLLADGGFHDADRGEQPFTVNRSMVFVFEGVSPEIIEATGGTGEEGRIRCRLLGRNDRDLIFALIERSRQRGSRPARSHNHHCSPVGTFRGVRHGCGCGCGCASSSETEHIR